MKYAYAILCLAMGIIIGFELLEVKEPNAVFMVIFIILAWVCKSMKTED